MKAIDENELPNYGVVSFENQCMVYNFIKEILEGNELEEAEDTWKITTTILKEPTQEESAADDEEGQAQDQEGEEESKEAATELIPETCKMTVALRQFADNDSKVFVEFKKKGGSTALFLRHFLQLRQQIANFTGYDVANVTQV